MERDTKGSKGNSKGSKGKPKGGAKGIAPCVYVVAMCMLKNNWMLNDCSDKMIPIVHIAIARTNASCK